MLGDPPAATSNAPTAHATLGAKILHMAHQLAQWSESAEGLTCTYFSPAHRAVSLQLRDWMRAAGLSAEIDAVGNVIGRRESADPAAKTLIVGSHYDTVANAGKFDGRLGILTGIVVAEHLNAISHRSTFHLDIVGFSEEEGVRFSTPYLGSRAIVGRFDTATLQLRDRDGVSLATVLAEHGSDLPAIRALARTKAALRGYIEVHIEQGPVLLERELPVGVVTSIASSARFRITIHGRAGHAGTVPMHFRWDAAAAAAEIILAVEKRCSMAATLVGTVGQLNVPNGQINVIPATCELSLDVRAETNDTRDAAIADITAEIQEIAKRRRVRADIIALTRHDAVRCAPAMQSALADAVHRVGIEPFRLPSGAGHDAEMFAGLTDIGMLFVRCGNNGISHSPLETITADDADIAAQVLLKFLMALD